MPPASLHISAGRLVTIAIQPLVRPPRGPTEGQRWTHTQVLRIDLISFGERNLIPLVMIVGAEMRAFKAVDSAPSLI